MDFLEKQQTLRKIQEVNPGLVGLLTPEEIDEIAEGLRNGVRIEELVGTAEKATLRAAGTAEAEEEVTTSQPVQESPAESSVTPVLEKASGTEESSSASVPDQI